MCGAYFRTICILERLSVYTLSIALITSSIFYLCTTALIHYRAGEFQEAHSDAKKALVIYPGHVETKELMQLLAGVFTLS